MSYTSTKISALPSAGNLQAGDIVPIVRSGATFKAIATSGGGGGGNVVGTGVSTSGMLAAYTNTSCTGIGPTGISVSGSSLENLLVNGTITALGNVCSFNNINVGTTATVSSGGTTVLTIASTQIQTLTGSADENYQLPDATTLPVGIQYEFNNNGTGNLFIKDNGGTTHATGVTGSYVIFTLLDNTTTNGTWDAHGMVPYTATFGYDGLTVNGFVSVGSSNQFNVNNTGNITLINNVACNWPSSQGGANSYLRNDGAGNFSWVGGGPGSGNVSGPVSSSSTAIAVWADTTGTTLLNTQVLINSSGNISGVNYFTYSSGGSGSTGSLYTVSGGVRHFSSGDFTFLSASSPFNVDFSGGVLNNFAFKTVSVTPSGSPFAIPASSTGTYYNNTGTAPLDIVIFNLPDAITNEGITFSFVNTVTGGAIIQVNTTLSQSFIWDGNTGANMTTNTYGAALNILATSGNWYVINPEFSNVSWTLT